MKKALLLFFLCFGFTYLHAQSGVWTWMKGSPYVIGGVNDSLGVYGVKGVADTNNVPCPRAGMIYWKDLQGDFWFYGGSGFNDMWKYNVANNSWTWMNGPQYYSDTAGNAGVMGVPSASNVPHSFKTLYSWYDKAHENLWLWQSDNKLWKYNVSINMWTWVANMPPTNTVSFGTQGVEAASNNPGKLVRSATWCDTSGNLFLCGGQGRNPAYLADVGVNGNSNIRYLNTNDIWKYNVNSQMWTWLKGDSLKNGMAMLNTNAFNYGTFGVESPNNHTQRGVDKKVWQGADGMVYLTGGRIVEYGGIQNLYSQMNLFRYNPQTNNWTWMFGNAPVNISSYCDSNTRPFDKDDCTLTTNMDACSNDLLWRFGGYVGVTNSHPPLNCEDCQTNELYVYQPSSNKWKLLFGSFNTNSIPLNAGTKGIPSTSNWPDAVIGAAMWPDANGNLWIFGGGNDLCTQMGFFLRVMQLMVLMYFGDTSLITIV